MKGLNFEYYAIRVDFNTKKVNQFNIFDNEYVYNVALKAVVKYLTKAINYDEFCKELSRGIGHEMGGRVQYEISVGEAFENKIENFHKIDVYTQALANIDAIAAQVITAAKEFFYREDALNKYTEAEALRETIWVDIFKERTYANEDEAVRDIDDYDVDSAGCSDKMQYRNWYIKQYVAK